MRRTVASTLLAISLIMSVSCASESSEPGVSSSPGLPSQSTHTAQQAAESLQSSVQTVVRVIPIDEDNGPNALIGRPTGYIAATALVDSRTECETVDGKPATDCGAVIEQWPSQAAAEQRKAYIDGVLEAAPYSEPSTRR
ncbi:hypothetical protein GOHSU_28_00620 [Gordonia hirsuta DSM 44140 = NBRC 16056]|uniref:Lipoprotein n=1 Tax=Gordonia hirsuta DSM 44140 = NBRC 16056 TaxID=1121927 RepID=L7LD78_9ACTN|nr:hypothetical protein [Gordonia hirsuta]GAC58007.1 hypothetical protein GOHSU_28_00620 [Gordonia hirsuta DSM 44140 = NBRC 16056]